MTSSTTKRNNSSVKKKTTKKTASWVPKDSKISGKNNRVDPQITSQLVMLLRAVKKSSQGSIVSYRDYKLVTNLLERLARAKGIAPTKMLVDTRNNVIMKVQPSMLPRPSRKKQQQQQPSNAGSVTTTAAPNAPAAPPEQQAPVATTK